MLQVRSTETQVMDVAKATKTKNVANDRRILENGEKPPTNLGRTAFMDKPDDESTNSGSRALSHGDTNTWNANIEGRSKKE